MGTPYEEIEDQLNLSNAQAAKPWSDYGNAMILNAIANRNRQWNLQDVASHQQFEREMTQQQFANQQAASDAANEREIKRETERERLIALRQASEQYGLDLDPGASMQEIGRAIGAKKKEVATAVLKGYNLQLDNAKQDTLDAQEAITKIAQDKGSLQANKDALIATLADPSSRYISTKDKDRLNKLLVNATSASDIRQAVQDTVKDMQQNYFRPFKGKEAAFNRANDFFSLYSQNLAGHVDAEHKDMLLAAVNRMNTASSNEKAIYNEAAKHLTTNAGLIGEKEMDKWISDHGSRHGTIPSNPGDALGDITPEQNPGAGGEMPPPAVSQAAATRQTPATVPQADPWSGMSNTAQESGIVGMAKQLGSPFSNPGNPFLPWNQTKANFNDAVSGSADFLKSIALGNSRQVVSPPTTQAIQANRLAVDKQIIASASQDELAQAQDMAQQMGVTPDRMAKAQQDLKAGDPKAISSLSGLIQIVRRKRASAGVSTASALAPGATPPTASDLGATPPVTDAGFMPSTVPTYGPPQ